MLLGILTWFLPLLTNNYTVCYSMSEIYTKPVSSSVKCIKFFKKTKKIDAGHLRKMISMHAMYRSGPRL